MAGWALLLLGVMAAYISQVHLYWAQINDDAYITYRYSLHLARGLGPYFNPNEHVEGYTNFLHMVVLAGIARLSGPETLPFVSKLWGALAGAGCVAVAALLAWALLREHHSRTAPLAAVAAGALVAVNPSLAVNATTGLETTSYALFLGLGCLFQLTGNPGARWSRSAMAFAAAALSRPEGLLIFGVHWVSHSVVVRDRKRLATLVLVGGVVALHWLFRWVAYDGEWVPNTYYAKRGGHWDPAWPYVQRGILTPLGGGMGAVLAGLGWWLGGRGLRRRAVPLMGVALVGALSPFLTGTDWMIGYRLVVPYLPLAAPLVASGWMLLVRRFAPPLPSWAPGALWLVPGILWLAQDPGRRSLETHVAMRAEGYREGHGRLAEWCRAELRPTDTLALMDIGIVGFRCPENTLIDLTGLTDRHIARSEGTFLKKVYDPAYVFDRKPAVIVLVLGVDRSPIGLPDPGTLFYFINPIERRIAEAPEFQRDYRRPIPRELPADWMRAVAARAGAEAIFEHDHPGIHYLLAVFRRRE